MNEHECGWVREAIPDHARGRSSAAEAERIDRHVAACADCRAELDLVRLLYASRPRVPEMPHAMLERVEREARRQPPARTWWGISAAAIAALALGIGIVSNDAPSTEVPAFVREAEEGELWVSDDGLVAGAPALDDLSDEALLQLLDELTNVSTGGSA
jgi:anti-sigma factor RsiW